MSNKQPYEHDRSLQLPFIEFDTQPQLDRLSALYRSSLRQHALLEMQTLVENKSEQKDIMQIIDHWMSKLEQKAEQNYSVNGMKYSEFRALKSSVEPHNTALPAQIEEKARELDALQYRVGLTRKSVPLEYAALVSQLVELRKQDEEIMLEAAVQSLPPQEKDQCWTSEEKFEAAKVKISSDPEMVENAAMDRARVEVLMKHIPAQISKMDRLLELSTELQPKS